MEKFVFKKIDGTRIDNVEKYVKDWSKDNPYGKVIIGCDSQMQGRRIKYSIAIVMHHIDKWGGGHGAHVIFADVWEKRIAKSPVEEMPTKLWREAEYLLAVAQIVDGSDEMFKKRITLHLDYNSEAETGNHANLSNRLFSSGLGYLTSLGYYTEGKPYAYVATHTADAFCR